MHMYLVVALYIFEIDSFYRQLIRQKLLFKNTNF